MTGDFAWNIHDFAPLIPLRAADTSPNYFIDARRSLDAHA
nr:hypothetical protein HMPREF0276_0615 [Corynebacterium accolens ATCC 49725]